MPGRSRRIPPWKGASNATTYFDQPRGFAPLESMRNVLVHTPAKDRSQVGTIPGLTKAFELLLPGPPQGFCTVERAAGQTGLQVGSRSRVVGENREAGTLTGHCFVLDPTLSMVAAFRDPRGVGGAGTGVSWHPTLRKLCFGQIYNNAGRVVYGLNWCDVDSNLVQFQGDAEDRDDPLDTPGAEPIYGNHIAMHARYTFSVGNRWLWVHKTDTGEFLKRYALDDWPYETMAVRVRSDGTLAVSFWGTSEAATLPNQPAIAQNPGSGMYRSGVMLFEITDSDLQPLIRVPFGPSLAPTAPWYEANHGYARLAEFLARAPHGCIPFAMAVGPDDEIVVGMTNQGWGWNDTYPPDGRKPYRTVALLDSSGSLIWEADTQSPRWPYTGGWGTFFNDIPQIDADDDIPPTGTPKPGVNAVAIDGVGDVYAAGQRNAAGHNVFKLSGADGSILWRFDAGSVVEQHAMAVDPTDNNVWVGVMRNSAWTGAAGRMAVLLKLNGLNGEVLAHYDVAPAPVNGCWMVDVSHEGYVAFVIDYIA